MISIKSANCLVFQVQIGRQLTLELLEHDLIRVQLFDDRVLPIHPADQIDLLAAFAAKRKTGGTMGLGRERLLANRTGDRLDHDGVTSS